MRYMLSRLLFGLIFIFTSCNQEIKKTDFTVFEEDDTSEYDYLDTPYKDSSDIGLTVNVLKFEKKQPIYSGNAILKKELIGNKLFLKVSGIYYVAYMDGVVLKNKYISNDTLKIDLYDEEYYIDNDGNKEYSIVDGVCSLLLSIEIDDVNEIPKVIIIGNSVYKDTTELKLLKH